jgi:diphthamide synthase (EF-2-diphthine--ammonia ligase)
MKPKALLAWSSGKDGAWALHVLRQQGEVEVVGLLTTLNEAFGRVAMHAVRAQLLRAQAEAAGLPLAGPMFARPIAIRGGEVVERDGFVFADLVADAKSEGPLAAPCPIA